MLNPTFKLLHLHLGLPCNLLSCKVDVRPLDFFNFDWGIHNFSRFIFFEKGPFFFFFLRFGSGDGGELFDVALEVEELLELVVDFGDDLHDGRDLVNEIHGEVGDTLDDIVDGTVLHHHLLVVAFDLVVVAGLHEFGHVHVDLVFLSGKLVHEGPFEVGEVSYVRVIFIIRPNTVVMAFTPSLQSPHVLFLHKGVFNHV